MIDSQVIKLHVWLLGNVSLDLAHTETPVGVHTYAVATVIINRILQFEQNLILDVMHIKFLLFSE